MAKAELIPEVKAEIQKYYDDKVTNQIEKTVLRYSKSGSICRKIINLILSIFGQSDWQKTVRALRASDNRKEKGIRHDLKGETFTPKEIDKIISQIKKQTSSILNSIYNQELTNFVKKQNNTLISEKEKTKFNELQVKYEAKLDTILERIDSESK